MNVFLKKENGLSNKEIEKAIIDSLEGRNLNRVLIVPPDFTRFHSYAGYITNKYYHVLTELKVEVDILPALGTHMSMNEDELDKMFGDIPHERFIVHRWRDDVVKIGVVPKSFVSEISEGLWEEDIDVEVNRLVMDESYDLIISVGQVVPHEVVGMSNHAKNIFVGVGGSRIINSSHMLGAVYGMERMMGKDLTPVRKVYDYAQEHFLSDRPVLYALTVTTAPKGKTAVHGIFISEGRECFNRAVELAQETNIDFIDKPFKKCVVYLDPEEFKTTWLGNKAVYRTRMAMADGGDLIILAPGVERFGEDQEIDRLIRKYGYTGRLNILELFERPESKDLRKNMSAAAHLIHGSSDGRFNITYCVDKIKKEEIENVGYKSASYKEVIKKYNPETLVKGYNLIDGEEIYYIPNPALGLWIDREKFKD